MSAVEPKWFSKATIEKSICPFDKKRFLTFVSKIRRDFRQQILEKICTSKLLVVSYFNLRNSTSQMLHIQNHGHSLCYLSFWT